MNVGTFRNYREFDNPETAHELYHRQAEHDQYGLRTALGVFYSLGESSDVHHNFDAGWQAIDLAEVTEGRDREWLVSTAHALWKHVAFNGTTSAERYNAEFTDIFIPLFRADENCEVDLFQLKTRLGRLLTKVTTMYQRTGDPELLGLTNEVATTYLLARLAHKTKGATPLAWPAKSWEDRHHSDRDEDMTAENFDLHLGQYPFSFRKIQVKSFLDQGIEKQHRAGADGDRLLERWRRRYRHGIDLVFGDVHLGCCRDGHKKALSKLLDSDRNGNIINLATNNLIDELSDEVLDLTQFRRPTSTVS